jgi:hypothetical protein
VANPTEKVDMTQPTNSTPYSPSTITRWRKAILATLALACLLAALGLVLALRWPSPGPPTAGCTIGSTDEIYVQHVYDCPDGTRVVTFDTTAARDDYLTVAEHFGSVTVEKGAVWARVRT